MYVSGDELHMKFSTWRAVNLTATDYTLLYLNDKCVKPTKKKLSTVCWKMCTRMQYSINLMANTEFQVWM